MLVLGIESSTPVASVALVGQEGLVAEFTLNIGLTHSEQLLPMIAELIEEARVSTGQLEGIAIASGPGSFTGLRIGMATAKALSQGKGLPLIAVPTLEALATTQSTSNMLIAPLMNARKSEVYTALYRFHSQKLEQIEPVQAISPQEWVKCLAAHKEKIVFLGDGVHVYQDTWNQLGELAVYPPSIMQGVRGSTVALLGRQSLLAGEADDLYKLKPFYLRPAEAQLKKQRLLQGK